VASAPRLTFEPLPCVYICIYAYMYVYIYIYIIRMYIHHTQGSILRVVPVPRWKLPGLPRMRLAPEATYTRLASAIRGLEWEQASPPGGAQPPGTRGGRLTRGTATRKMRRPAHPSGVLALVVRQ
jgi:hypothetical protein